MLLSGFGWADGWVEHKTSHIHISSSKKCQATDHGHHVRGHTTSSLAVLNFLEQLYTRPTLYTGGLGIR